MNMRRPDGRETWNRLLDWDKGQTPSERLVGTLMVSEGYAGFDPSHPLGGQDGTKDAVLRKDSLKLVMAVYFPRGQQSFAEIKKKFSDDLTGVDKNKADGLVFCTNQELRLGERSELHGLANNIPIDIYHLERISTLLNVPKNYGIRLEFLQIAMTSEELLALYAQRDRDYLEQLSEITKSLNSANDRIVGHSTGGDSYLRFDVRPNKLGSLDVSAYIESSRSHSPGRYSLSSVNIEVIADNGNVVHNFVGRDFHFGVSNKFPELALPTDKDFRFYIFQIFARNGQYRQYFMFKKIRGSWYFHALRWNDSHYYSIRQEEFQDEYPAELKNQIPAIGSYRPAAVDEKRTLESWPGRENDAYYGL